jgi:hypothetical protein
MDAEERKAWVARGFLDPRRAYAQHAARAGQRGIPFRLTFAEWWALWAPHYERRGVRAGQLCMCRDRDAGAYEVGNVRIDVVRSNHQERSVVHQVRNSASCWRAGSTGYSSDQSAEWIANRARVFDPYVEEDA